MAAHDRSRVSQRIAGFGVLQFRFGGLVSHLRFSAICYSFVSWRVEKPQQMFASALVVLGANRGSITWAAA